METNIILAGVGGQGIVSISYVIDMAAAKAGLHFKQAEVHGMSQRGGAVVSHLRLSDQPIYSDLVPKGRAGLVLSVEPLESLRYVEYLAPDGAIVTGTDPHVNIKDYPDLEALLDTIGALPGTTLVAAERLARSAGSARAANMVLLGAASPYVGLPDAALEECLLATWARKGEKVQRTNVAAFRAGAAAGRAYRACREAGVAARVARALVARVDGGNLSPEAVPAWRDLLGGPQGAAVSALLTGEDDGRLAGTIDVPRALAAAPSGAELAPILFRR